MHSTTHSCLTQTRCITACLHIRGWWRGSCASSFRRSWSPASISAHCSVSIPSFTLAAVRPDGGRADVIWRVPTREGGDYLYLLIEFQSESDGWMSVRTQVYQGLLWQQVIDEHKLQAGARLPPLLLLVLYNGERPWKAATTTGELIGLSPDSALWPWQPQVRYQLLDMGAFPKDELARRCSLTALLFRLEQRHSPQGLEELLEEVIDWFQQHEGCERLQGLFAELIREAVARCGMKLSRSDNLLEMKPMLTIDFEAFRQQSFAEGEAKGKAEALICLLAERFGAVAPPWRKRIQWSQTGNP
jgi:hypothetical protein